MINVDFSDEGFLFGVSIFIGIILFFSLILTEFCYSHEQEMKRLELQKIGCFEKKDEN